MNKYAVSERKFWNTKSIVKSFAADPPSPELRLFLLEIQKSRKGNLRVLDIGCGAGRNFVLLVGMGFDAHACDGSKAMVHASRKRLMPKLGNVAKKRIIHAVAANLPYAPDSFDVVILYGVLHNSVSLLEFRSVIKEAARVLRPRGFLYLNSFYFSGTMFNLKRIRKNIFVTPRQMRMVLLPKWRILKYITGFGLRPIKKIKVYRKVFFTGERDILYGTFRKKTGE